MHSCGINKSLVCPSCSKINPKYGERNLPIIELLKLEIKWLIRFKVLHNRLTSQSCVPVSVSSTGAHTGVLMSAVGTNVASAILSVAQ